MKLIVAALAFIALSACQKEGIQPATTTVGLTKSTLVVGPPPVITWWANGGVKGYVMDGQFPMTNGNYIWLQALWMFDPASQSWSKQSMASAPYLTGTESLFVIGDNAYVVTGNQVWQYNQPSNQWTQKNNFPGAPRLTGSAVAINGKGYFGLGDETNGVLKDWWQYDPATDTWTKKQNCPASGMAAPATATIGGVVMGLMTDGQTREPYMAVREVDPQVS
jgi:N-acetylneuraminic acid mutarotase